MNTNPKSLNQEVLITELKQNGIVDTIMNELQITVGHSKPDQKGATVRTDDPIRMAQSDHAVTSVNKGKKPLNRNTIKLRPYMFYFFFSEY